MFTFMAGIPRAQNRLRTLHRKYLKMVGQTKYIDLINLIIPTLWPNQL